MKEHLTDEQVQSIIKVLDETLADESWEKSSFLKIIGKNINQLKNKLVTEIDKNENSSHGVHPPIGHKIHPDNTREIYITLYSNEGNFIPSWERIIANLPKQMISRPIYACEDDVCYLIKSKENKYNEAYVAILIDVNDLLTISEDKAPKDKFGKSLLSLKDKTLKIENIIRFEHVSGTYVYSKGRLILKN